MNQDRCYRHSHVCATTWLSMSRHILQNEDDASDAIQEAFCRLWPIQNKIKSEKEAAALTSLQLVTFV